MYASKDADTEHTQPYRLKQILLNVFLIGVGNERARVVLFDTKNVGIIL
jgi:hypothetical protein